MIALRRWQVRALNALLELPCVGPALARRLARRLMSPARIGEAVPAMDGPAAFRADGAP